MELTRGDTGRYKFQRSDADGNPILTVPSAMYFTVKKRYDSDNVILQKRLEDMTMDESGFWHFTIEPADTQKKLIGDYVFDIEVTTDNVVQTIAKGTLSLTEEATWYTDK